jgi:hypothetical protein
VAYGGAIAIDITDRLRAEEALLLRDRAIEASVNPIVIVDARTRVCLSLCQSSVRAGCQLFQR